MSEQDPSQPPKESTAWTATDNPECGCEHKPCRHMGQPMQVHNLRARNCTWTQVHMALEVCVPCSNYHHSTTPTPATSATDRTGAGA